MKLKNILFEKRKDNDLILIPGFGKMTFDQLKKNIQKKVDDLQKHIKKDDYNYTDNMLNVLFQFIKTARDFSKKK